MPFMHVPCILVCSLTLMAVAKDQYHFKGFLQFICSVIIDIN